MTTEPGFRFGSTRSQVRILSPRLTSQGLRKGEGRDSGRESDLSPTSAFERGTYTITLTPKADGEPMQDIGKYPCGLQTAAQRFLE